jgi:hypothetical protein
MALNKGYDTVGEKVKEAVVKVALERGARWEKPWEELPQAHQEMQQKANK